MASRRAAVRGVTVSICSRLACTTGYGKPILGLLDCRWICGTSVRVKRSTFGRVKDAALRKAVLLLLGPKLERYGEIQELEVDTVAKLVSARVLLRGEEVPLVVDQAHYRIETQGEQSILVVHDVKVSKPWVQNLIDDHMPEIRVKIPNVVRSLID